MITKLPNSAGTRLVCFTASFFLGLTVVLIPLSVVFPAIVEGSRSFSVDGIRFTNIEKTILAETIPDTGISALSIPPIPVLPISNMSQEMTAIRIDSTDSNYKFIADLPFGAIIRHSFLLSQDRGDFIAVSGTADSPNLLRNALITKGWERMTNDKESNDGASSWIHENKTTESLLVLEKTGDFFVVRRTKFPS